ncbi:LysM domain-containing protein [Rhexocercosporidium sp. MPI-PUGE-AT-0058]|nr:LysM domain-containing protein [Rhexocercosporidium sp. MPI-PUGE-AT-0058]
MYSKYSIIGWSILVIGAAAAVTHPRDDKPGGQFDPKTTSYCSWWQDNDGSMACSAVPDYWGISLADFLRWNPSLTSSCGNFKTGWSYCVETKNEPPPVVTTTAKPTTSKPTSTSTKAPPTTTTQPGNGISTPAPIQDGLVSDCDAFYFVQAGDTCTTIASKNGISVAQFILWNPAARSDCSGLWAEVYACVSIIGHTPTKVTTAPATTTKASNGITTPTPIQDGMVSNCDAFYFVVSGDTCATISSKKGITLTQFVAWNPAAKSDCSGLWANTYACISIVGHTPPTSTTATPTITTKTGNGVATPTPIQTGMVKNCKSFYFVKSGDTCTTIATANKITVANFISWNPAAKSDCTGLWANTYACIATL